MLPLSFGRLSWPPLSTRCTAAHEHLVLCYNGDTASQPACLCAAIAGAMQLPPYFLATVNHCPTFPMKPVDFGQSLFRPIPGVKVTRDHPAVIPV